MVKKLLIATHNDGKLNEFRALLAGLPLALISPADLEIDLQVTESGESYLENARLKSAAYATSCGFLALADDSGLEVDALDGAPGVRSARYVLGDDANRIAALLRALDRAGVPPDERTAQFRCVISVTDPNGQSWSAEGTCRGTIIDTPRGSGGFGYDPVFYLPTHGCTMAELPPQEKNQISHRAHAVQAIRPILAKLIHASGV